MDRSGLYTGWHEATGGRTQHYEITGPLKFLNHSCSPNAQLPPRKLVALRPIRAGAEITISYGNGTCKCRTGPQILPKSSSQGFEVAA